MSLFQRDREEFKQGYTPRVGGIPRVGQRIVNMTPAHKRSLKRSVSNANMARKGLRKLFP